MKINPKKTFIYTFSTLVLLIAVLFVHIYWVYRPAPDASTLAMARIDIKQPITQDQASKITTWMVHQKGVDRVLVNPKTKIVVFTFFTLKANGNQITNNFKSAFHLKVERFMPGDDDQSNSCPVIGSSYAYKIYKLISKII